MTKEELINLPHLMLVEERRLLSIHAEPGYVICNKPEDMIDYGFTSCYRTNYKDEYEELEVISDEENEKRMELKKARRDEEDLNKYEFKDED